MVHKKAKRIQLTKQKLLELQACRLPRKVAIEKFGCSKSSFYRHLKNPKRIETLRENEGIRVPPKRAYYDVEEKLKEYLKQRSEEGVTYSGYLIRMQARQIAAEICASNPERRPALEKATFTEHWLQVFRKILNKEESQSQVSSEIQDTSVNTSESECTAPSEEEAIEENQPPKRVWDLELLIKHAQKLINYFDATNMLNHSSMAREILAQLQYDLKHGPPNQSRK